MTVSELGRRMTWQEFATWMLFTMDEQERRDGTTPMTDDEMLNTVKTLNAMYGGKVVEA